MRRLGFIALGLIAACGAFEAGSDGAPGSTTPGIDAGGSSSGNPDAGASSSSSGGEAIDGGGEVIPAHDAGNDPWIYQKKTIAGATSTLNSTLTLGFDYPAPADDVVIVGLVALDEPQNPIESVHDDQNKDFAQAAWSHPTSLPSSAVWWSAPVDHVIHSVTVKTKNPNGRVAMWILDAANVVEADDNSATSSLASTKMSAPLLNVKSPAVVVSVGAIASGADIQGTSPASKFTNIFVDGVGSPTFAMAYRLHDVDEPYGAEWMVAHGDTFGYSVCTVSFTP